MAKPARYILRLSLAGDQHTIDPEQVVPSQESNSHAQDSGQGDERDEP